MKPVPPLRDSRDRYLRSGVTIRDVAREAGVSPTTVSRVFNRRDLVSDATRDHVLGVVRRLQYVPNASARSLSISRTRVLGLVLPLPYGEFFAELIRGIDEAAVAGGYDLLIAGSHDSVEKTLSAFRLMKGQVDGIIVVSPNIELGVLADAVPDELPALYLYSRAPNPAHHALCVDNRGGAYEAVRHLLGLGHRRVAVVKGPDVNPETRERLEGYERALAEEGIVPDPALVCAGAFTFESGEAAGRQLLALAERPTAVFALNDDMALGVVHALHAAGVRVPDDMAVIGFDDIPGTRHLIPALSTVHVPIYEMGRRAVEIVTGQIERRSPSPPAATVFATTLVARASTLRATA